MVEMIVEGMRKLYRDESALVVYDRVGEHEFQLTESLNPTPSLESIVTIRRHPVPILRPKLRADIMYCHPLRWRKQRRILSRPTHQRCDALLAEHAFTCAIVILPLLHEVMF